MKRYLIIKLSSLGDVIHLLPALTDVMAHREDIRFDWVVEKGFSEIPKWHPLVDRVIPIQLRQLRQAPSKLFRSKEWRAFYRAIRAERYEGVIDAQGLLKSALIARFARGQHLGPNWHGAREHFASLLYDKRFHVANRHEAHAVTRMRQLFSNIFHYPLPTDRPHFGISVDKLTPVAVGKRYYVFLHGTTWSTKHWPEAYWVTLARLAGQQGEKVYLPWGAPHELARAQRIQQLAGAHVHVLPKHSLAEITYILAHARGVVAVDTGLGHIGAAVGVPILSLYGPTNPTLIGALGPLSDYFSAKYDCAPCFKRTCMKEQPGVQPPCFTTVQPEQVWTQLQQMVIHEHEAI